MSEREMQIALKYADEYLNWTHKTGAQSRTMLMYFIELAISESIKKQCKHKHTYERLLRLVTDRNYRCKATYEKVCKDCGETLDSSKVGGEGAER